MRNFTDIHRIPKSTLRKMIAEGKEMKARRHGSKNGALDDEIWLNGCAVGLIFEKPSTRTRVSFDMGVRQMGGESMVLSGSELQLTNGENVSDTAKVVSGYLDMMMIRTSDERVLSDFTSSSGVPVINGLTDNSHPCQIMADIFTFEELRGDIEGKKVAWVGDGNNVCASYIHAAVQFGFSLVIASPQKFLPDKDLVRWANASGAQVDVLSNPNSAAKNADLVVTDTHISMHDDKSTMNSRYKILQGSQVNQALMEKAKANAIFLHCLPAHRNFEVTSDVIDGSQSAVFEAAENRLHIQKAIMKWCIHGYS